MKKNLIVWLFCAVLLMGCGRSDEAKAVDERIDALEEITLSSKKDLDEISKAIESLSDNDRKALRSFKKLEKYQSEYEQLVFNDEVSKLESRINVIGYPSLSKAEKIKDIRAAYDKSSEEVKAAISNYDVLTDAEDSLEELEKEQIISHAKAVSDDISHILIEGISLANSKEVANARDGYNKLTDDEKELVTNLSKLEEAESLLVNLQKDCLDRTKHIRDDFKQADFYMCSTHPEYLNDRTFILPYLVKTDSTLNMRGFYSYNGSDWIFWDKIYVITDENNYTISASSWDIERDVCNAYDLTESYDTLLSNKDIAMFQDIAYSDKALARFEGQYSSEYEINEKDKASIRDVLATYDYLRYN